MSWIETIKQEEKRYICTQAEYNAHKNEIPDGVEVIITDNGIPLPTVSDEGKALKVNNEGKYELGEISGGATINNVPVEGDLTSSDLGLQGALNSTQLDAVNSGITSAKRQTYDGYASTKQNALTTPQLKAVNSGITAEKVADYDDYEQEIAQKSTVVGTADANNKWDKLSIDGVEKDIAGVKSITAGKGIKVDNNKISNKATYVITEDMFDLTTDSTKGVAPYSTSYGYTNITIHSDAGVEWIEGAIYSFVLDTKVATSTYRNVRLRIGTTGDYIPMMGTSSTIASGSTVFIKGITCLFIYKTTYQSGGALHTFYDTNTTYTVNYLYDAGKCQAGEGTYAITRYALCMQKPNGTWEKIVDPTKTYSTATTKTVNTHGFVFNQIKYYKGSANIAGGGFTATNDLTSQSASVDMRYSTNCGTPSWTSGQYIYLVGSVNSNDGLFYLDTTQWWTNALPTQNDGKLYIQIGIVLTDNSYTASLLQDRPVFYHDGTSVKEYIRGGGGEPDNYLKSASVNGLKLTLTDQDDTTTTFSKQQDVLVCSDSQTTTTRTIACDGFVLRDKAHIKVLFKYRNWTYDPITINVNGTGAHEVSYRTNGLAWVQLNANNTFENGTTLDLVYDEQYGKWEVVKDIHNTDNNKFWINGNGFPYVSTFNGQNGAITFNLYMHTLVIKTQDVDPEYIGSMQVINNSSDSWIIEGVDLYPCFAQAGARILENYFWLHNNEGIYELWKDPLGAGDTLPVDVEQFQVVSILAN